MIWHSFLTSVDLKTKDIIVSCYKCGIRMDEVDQDSECTPSNHEGCQCPEECCCE